MPIKLILSGQPCAIGAHISTPGDLHTSSSTDSRLPSTQIESTLTYSKNSKQMEGTEQSKNGIGLITEPPPPKNETDGETKTEVSPKFIITRTRQNRALKTKKNPAAETMPNQDA